MYESLVKIPIADFHLNGYIAIPVWAKSLVIFSHGSGGNRFSPRNKMVARELRQAGYGTLLFDYMGEHEDEDYEKRFDIKTLTKRLLNVTKWVKNQKMVEGYDLAYFGAGLGSAMAFNAAAELGDNIKAIACRGANTNFIDEKNILKIKSPTLLIAGERDESTIKQSRSFINKLNCPAELIIIPKAGHLLQKPHMMQRVAQETIDWYNQYLKKGKRHPEREYDTPDPEY